MIQSFLKFIGILTLTEKEWGKMCDHHGQRIMDEYKERRKLEEKIQAWRTVAMDLAGKYKDLDKVRKLL